MSAVTRLYLVPAAVNSHAHLGHEFALVLRTSANDVYTYLISEVKKIDGGSKHHHNASQWPRQLQVLLFFNVSDLMTAIYQKQAVLERHMKVLRDAQINIQSLSSYPDQ